MLKSPPRPPKSGKAPAPAPKPPPQFNRAKQAALAKALRSGKKNADTDLDGDWRKDTDSDGA